MAQTKEKKEFKAGLYAVVSGVVIAVVLVLLTIFAFTTRYTAFDAEKVAQVYTDTIVQTGDGYNAYKNSLVSKNMKYGDFIRNAYMRPYVNDGDDAKKADFVGTGNEQEQEAVDKVYDTMYDYYVELINTVGLDDYDTFFNSYFAKLVEVRAEVYGDDYMDTEYMFGAFESNVDTYGKSLTGTDRVIASDNKTITQEKTVGLYQEMYGKETEVDEVDVVDGKKVEVKGTKLVYKMTSTVKECTTLNDEETKAYIAEYKERITPVAASGEAKADKFGLEDVDSKHKYKTAMADAFAGLDCSDDISAVAKATVEVALEDNTVIATQELYVVQIGNSWYVDNTNIDTSALYIAK